MRRHLKLIIVFFISVNTKINNIRSIYTTQLQRQHQSLFLEKDNDCCLKKKLVKTIKLKHHDLEEVYHNNAVWRRTMKNWCRAKANRPDGFYRIHRPVDKTYVCLVYMYPFVEPVRLRFHRVIWHAFDQPLLPKQINQTMLIPKVI